MVMIESVQFKNFKVLRDAELPLGRFTLIVGPNGSGKSTALQALGMAGSPSQHFYNQIVTAGLNGAGAPAVEIIINWSEKSKTLHKWTPGDTGDLGFADSQGVPLPYGDLQRKLLQWLNGVRIYSLDPKQIAQAMPLTPMPNYSPMAETLWSCSIAFEISTWSDSIHSMKLSAGGYRSLTEFSLRLHRGAIGHFFFVRAMGIIRYLRRSFPMEPFWRWQCLRSLIFPTLHQWFVWKTRTEVCTLACCVMCKMRSIAWPTLRTLARVESRYR